MFHNKTCSVCLVVLTISLSVNLSDQFVNPNHANHTEHKESLAIIEIEREGKIILLRFAFSMC